MNKLNILIVDDEPINIQLVAELLVNDYNILVANSGMSALNIVENKPPHIILLDINMPNMNGFEVVEKIHEQEQNKEIPIVFFTADSSIDYMGKGFDLGAVDYITKPIDPRAFKLKVAFWAKLVQKTIEGKQKQKLLDQYKNTVDRSSIVSKTDKKGVITFINDKFCEISGYTREELIGKSHNIVRHKEMSASTFRELWETIQSKKPWFGVVKNCKKNGEEYIVDTVINPIIGEDGEIVEYIGVRHDITELEKYKELLKDELSHTSKTLEENLKYMQQYESAINAVTAVLKTDTNNIITYVNEKFCELMGYQPEELISQDCSELRDEKHKITQDCEKIKNKLKQKKATTKLFTNITKEGNKLYLITFFYPILDLNSNVVEHLQIMHDVTEIINLKDEIESTQKEVVFTMGAIGETRSKETGLHVKRVAEYSYLLAKLAGLSEEKANLLKQASPMHDIGKVGIPDNILNKPDKLTPEEFEFIKTHSQMGYEMLKHSKRDILKAAAVIAYTHHEKYDGSGYPNKLKGSDIPIEGRITAVSDVFDALGHDRCYKKAWQLEDILELFQKESGKHFDPDLIDLFLENLNKFLVIRDTFKD